MSEHQLQEDGRHFVEDFQRGTEPVPRESVYPDFETDRGEFVDLHPCVRRAEWRGDQAPQRLGGPAARLQPQPELLQPPPQTAPDHAPFRVSELTAEMPTRCGDSLAGQVSPSARFVVDPGHGLVPVVVQDLPEHRVEDFEAELGRLRHAVSDFPRLRPLSRGPARCVDEPSRCQPPPTGRTISRMSPSRRVTSGYCSRLRTSPL